MDRSEPDGQDPIQSGLVRATGRTSSRPPTPKPTVVPTAPSTTRPPVARIGLGGGPRSFWGGPAGTAGSAPRCGPGVAQIDHSWWSPPGGRTRRSGHGLPREASGMSAERDVSGVHSTSNPAGVHLARCSAADLPRHGRWPGSRARRCRTVQIRAGQHLLTAEDPLPDDLREALALIGNPNVRTNRQESGERMAPIVAQNRAPGWSLPGTSTQLLLRRPTLRGVRLPGLNRQAGRLG